TVIQALFLRLLIHFASVRLGLMSLLVRIPELCVVLHTFVFSWFFPYSIFPNELTKIFLLPFKRTLFGSAYKINANMLDPFTVLSNNENNYISH
ncbi:hypothetical protein ACJX0J_030855, partial [Zea mays]